MAFSQDTIRAEFPLLQKNPTLHYLDSAATSLKPECVIHAMNEYNGEYSANVHRGLYDLSERATNAYEEARKTVAKFINAKSEREIIFTSGTTQSINMVALGWARHVLKQGDEIVIPLLEHHSNMVPWQMLAKELALKIIYWEPKKDGTLDPADANKYLTRRTKLLVVTHISNVLGTLTPLKQIIQKSFSCGVKVLVDAAQSIARLPIDVQLLDCDFLAFSGHKAYGPTGIGVLYVKEKLLDNFKPVFGGGGMIREVTTTHTSWNDAPYKYEAGTPPIAEAIGLARALNFIKQMGLSAIHSHEKALTNVCLSELKKVEGVKILGPQKEGTHESIISFMIDGVHAHDIATLLNEKNVAVRAGHHCAMPLMKWLGVAATTRVSFGMYNTEDDVHALIEGIKFVKAKFKL